MLDTTPGARLQAFLTKFDDVLAGRELVDRDPAG
jgi:hypothetical protein